MDPAEGFVSACIGVCPIFKELQGTSPSCTVRRKQERERRTWVWTRPSLSRLSRRPSGTFLTISIYSAALALISVNFRCLSDPLDRDVFQLNLAPWFRIFSAYFSSSCPFCVLIPSNRIWNKISNIGRCRKMSIDRVFHCACRKIWLAYFYKVIPYPRT